MGRSGTRCSSQLVISTPEYRQKMRACATAGDTASATSVMIPTIRRIHSSL
jgi:hypothetical protein